MEIYRKINNEREEKYEMYTKIYQQIALYTQNNILIK